MKNIVFYIFIFFKKYFSIETGKSFVSRFITSVFGSFLIRTNSKITLDLFCSSSQDLYLLNVGADQSDVVFDLVNNLKSGDLFFDVGTNIGLFSFLAAKRVGKDGGVVSFEPSHREYIRFLKGFNYNYSNKIIAFNGAVGNISGRKVIMLTTTVGHTGMNQINTSTSSDQVCFCFSIDEVVKDLQIKSIDLIKIDVEGAELLVLQSATNTLQSQIIKKLVIEITPNFLSIHNHSKEMLYEYLDNYGYKPIINSNDWQYDEVFVL